MATADITTFTSVLTAVGGLLVTAFGYVGYQNRRDQLASIRKAFDEVVDALATGNEERRLASAILLRRFFDGTSEFGLRAWLFSHRRAPYAKEAVSVAVAVLRGLETGNFQKLLADSLAYAPDLKSVDLQKTNLQNAYLRPNRSGVTLAGADFYRADLSGASLKNTCVVEGVFYQARLCHTVFKGADLRRANFFQADLTGAQFEGALLAGASFKDARNVPGELVPLLDGNGIYTSDQPAPKQVIGAASQALPSSNRRVFFSMPSHRTAQQQMLVDHFSELLKKEGLLSEELPRSEYPQFGQLSEVRRRMSGCCGAVIFGFDQHTTESPLPALSTGASQQEPLGPTPWNHVEAGLAFALDLPLLIMPCSTGERDF